MKQIGIYLPFLDDLYLLGDKICHNRYDKHAKYMSTDSPKTGKFAIKMSQDEQIYNGVKGKYAIGEIKRYKVIGTLWRQKRQHIKPVPLICTALVCRRSNLFN